MPSSPSPLSGSDALWRAPIVSIVAALVAGRIVRWIDDYTQWSLFGFGVEGARTVLGALSSSLLTFIVFAFSILLLSVQIASGQLSPRVIALIFRNRTIRLAIACFVFAWVFSLKAISRVEADVPQLLVAVAIVLSIVSVGVFLYLVTFASHALRPVSVLTAVANDTRAVVDSVYPKSFTKPDGDHERLSLVPDLPTRTVEHRGRSGVVLALDVEALIAIATQAQCVIEILPMVGDFLATGEELFRLRGRHLDRVQERSLFRCIALGPERTLDQDPAFGFRIIVDIAAKALSPAINDPTTAVLAIDQLHHLLQLVGHRQLDTGVFRDGSGDVRLVYRTPDWEDFVRLAATEIRLYSARSPQVTRRLQAMFERLVESLPAERAAAIHEQMSLLRGTIERAYDDPSDREIANGADLQGFGSRPFRSQQ